MLNILNVIQFQAHSNKVRSTNMKNNSICSCFMFQRFLENGFGIHLTNPKQKNVNQMDFPI